MRGKPITPEEMEKHSAPGLTEKQILSRVHVARRLAVTGIDQRRKERRDSYQAHKEKRIAKVREYQQSNEEKVKLWKRRWEEVPENKEHKRKYHADLVKQNKAHYAKALKDWRKANPDAVKAQKRRAYLKTRETAQGQIENRVRCLMHYSLRIVGKKKNGRTFKMLGYSVEDLIAHLEANFLPGMSWDNMGAWHIDHVLPLTCWSYTDEHHPEFKAAWALANLRPLWAKENISKHARVPELSDFPVTLKEEEER